MQGQKNFEICKKIILFFWILIEKDSLIDLKINWYWRYIVFSFKKLLDGQIFYCSIYFQFGKSDTHLLQSPNAQKHHRIPLIKSDSFSGYSSRFIHDKYAPGHPPTTQIHHGIFCETSTTSGADSEEDTMKRWVDFANAVKKKQWKFPICAFSILICLKINYIIILGSHYSNTDRKLDIWQHLNCETTALAKAVWTQMKNSQVLYQKHGITIR